MRINNDPIHYIDPSVTVLTLDGLDGDDTFTIINIPATLDVNFIGGDGSDTLVVAKGANTWTIDGEDEGNISGDNALTFSEMENLTGGTGTDNFVFEEGASIASVPDNANLAA